MKILWTVPLILVLLSCKEISYKNPQPRGKKPLPSVPQDLWGSYLITNDRENTKDTLFINATGYMIASDKEQEHLGDSLVLKFYKGYYFLSVNENPEWLLRVLRKQSNGDLMYMSMDTEENNFQALLEKLSKEVDIDSLTLNNEKLYQIDPSPRQLVRLVKKGFFDEVFRMQKIR
jgi:hypothetical protein